MTLQLTAAEVKDYLSIDYVDERTDRLLERYINLADKFLVGALGENYPGDDERVKEIALLVIGDLYDDHSLDSAKTNNSVRRLLLDFQLQLRLEMIDKGE